METFGDRLAIATSLGAEDMVVLDLVARAVEKTRAKMPRAFVIDTGRLHEETRLFLDRVRAWSAVPIQVFVPSSTKLESLVNEQGLYGFRESIENRRACCAARKLEPLGRALDGADAWMTGLRRSQSVTRAAIEEVEQDGPRTKISPLASWSEADVKTYLAEHHVPVHPLHAEGYPSIGCEPCTRAIAPGEDERAGRWWWESAEHKECGLHPIRRSR